jgi:hypothetical protein
VACVEHRTIGRWAGDYSVLSRGRVPSVHFLVGQDRGQWVQFWDTNWTAAHAAGANEYAVGIEFSGQNGEPLTDWQIEAGSVIHQWLIAAHGIRREFLDNGGPRVGYFEGFLNHSNVATTPQYTHYDYIERSEWDRMVSGSVEEDDFMALFKDLEQFVQHVSYGVDRAMKGPRDDVAGSTLESAQTVQTILQSADDPTQQTLIVNAIDSVLSNPHPHNLAVRQRLWDVVNGARPTT